MRPWPGHAIACSGTTACAPARDGRRAGLIGGLPPKCWASGSVARAGPPARGAGAGRRGSPRGVAPGRRTDLPRRRRTRRASTSSATRTAARSTSARRSTCGGGCARTSRSGAGAASSRRSRGRPPRSGTWSGSEIEALLREAVADPRAAAAGERSGRSAGSARRARAACARARRARPRAVGRGGLGRARRRARRWRLADCSARAGTARDLDVHTRALDAFFRSPLRDRVDRCPAARADRVLVARGPRRERDAARSARRADRPRACARVCAALLADERAVYRTARCGYTPEFRLDLEQRP